MKTTTPKNTTSQIKTPSHNDYWAEYFKAKAKYNVTVTTQLRKATTPQETQYWLGMYIK